MVELERKEESTDKVGGCMFLHDSYCFQRAQCNSSSSKIFLSTRILEPALFWLIAWIFAERYEVLVVGPDTVRLKQQLLFETQERLWFDPSQVVLEDSAESSSCTAEGLDARTAWNRSVLAKTWLSLVCVCPVHFSHLQPSRQTHFCAKNGSGLLLQTTLRTRSVE